MPHGGASDDDGYDMTGASGPVTRSDVRNYLAAHSKVLGPAGKAALLAFIADAESHPAQPAAGEGDGREVWVIESAEGNIEPCLEFVETDGGRRCCAMQRGHKGPHRISLRGPAEQPAEAAGEWVPRAGERIRRKYDGLVVTALQYTPTGYVRYEKEDGSLGSDHIRSVESAGPFPSPPAPPSSPKLGGPCDALERRLIEALRTEADCYSQNGTITPAFRRMLTSIADRLEAGGGEGGK